MYDIRQFRPTLYMLLLLVFTGYAVAAQAPGIWVLAVGATVLHMYLYKHDLFRPLPRLVANALTLLFAAWLVMRVRTVSGPPILAICEFLVFLQLIKLYEERGNRDLAQLLVLSLLLMVAAAISTGTLVFALLSSSTCSSRSTAACCSTSRPRPTTPRRSWASRPKRPAP
jgi:hypothetical protein